MQITIVIFYVLYNAKGGPPKTFFLIVLQLKLGTVSGSTDSLFGRNVDNIQYIITYDLEFNWGMQKITTS